MRKSKKREVNGSKLRRRGLAVKVSRNSKKRDRWYPQIPLEAEVGRGPQLGGRNPHLLNHHHHQRKRSRVTTTNPTLRSTNGGTEIEAMMIWTRKSSCNKT
jgi:hypothetical protein